MCQGGDFTAHNAPAGGQSLEKGLKLGTYSITSVNLLLSESSSCSTLSEVDVYRDRQADLASTKYIQSGESHTMPKFNTI